MARASNSNGATLWQAADKLRNTMDAAEYKHVVLGPRECQGKGAYHTDKREKATMTVLEQAELHCNNPGE